MTSRQQFHRPILLAAALAFFAGFAASPVRADQCDDIAKQLADAIDGLKVNFKAANLVGSAAAVIFTLPKDDTMTGTARCLKRMGLLRGDKITMRYRRLDMECSRTKKDTSITVRRGLDQ